MGHLQQKLIMRLRVEYSVNGVDWNRASIVGDTLVGRGGYSGYLVWRSGADLPGYYGCWSS